MSRYSTILTVIGCSCDKAASALSPLHNYHLRGLTPALVVVPMHDPLVDHGHRYAERLTRGQGH